VGQNFATTYAAAWPSFGKSESYGTRILCGSYVECSTAPTSIYHVSFQYISYFQLDHDKDIAFEIGRFYYGNYKSIGFLEQLPANYIGCGWGRALKSARACQCAFECACVYRVCVHVCSICAVCVCARVCVFRVCVCFGCDVCCYVPFVCVSCVCRYPRLCQRSQVLRHFGEADRQAPCHLPQHGERSTNCQSQSITPI
jgi:hypothetical protein